jgi:glycosyltransferase involved in cell wall biosynthesis
MISVIIPVYNREEELTRAVSSVLRQTVQDFEIIIVDDCSDIDLKSLVDSFLDKRIRYYRLNKRSNANVCRNKGITEAQGEFIAMLDSDDEWLPHHLESKIYRLTSQGADGVFGSCCIDNGKRVLDKISRPFHHGEKMVNYLLSDGMAPTPTHVYKTSVVREIMWDENLVRHQDWDFSVRFAEKFKFIPSYDISCVVYWKAGERRDEHFDSLISFINKNKKDIKPRLYFEYHRLFYTNIADRPEIEARYKQHYKREVLRYIDVISLKDYLSTFGNSKTKLGRLILRLAFVSKVLFKN